MTLVTDLSHTPEPVVVALPAEVDMATAGQAGVDLGSVIARNPCMVIADMTATRFCDSSGISMLVRAHKQAAANGIELRLVVRSAAVLRTMALTGVGDLLPIFPTVTQALATASVPEPQPHCERSWTARSP
jgi:anti-sigma B factor antagonist